MRVISDNLRQHKASGDLVGMVSDNQSWVDTLGASFNDATPTMKQWNAFAARNRGAKLVCIDIQPYANTQAKERKDILNVGGFSDRVFDVVGTFADGTLMGDHWVGVIEKVQV